MESLWSLAGPSQLSSVVQRCPEKTDSSRAEALGWWPSRTAALERCCTFLHFLHTLSISKYVYEAQTHNVFHARAFSFFSLIVLLRPIPAHTTSRRYNKGNRLCLPNCLTRMTHFRKLWHENWKVSDKRKWHVAFADSQTCPVGVFTQTGECYSCVNVAGLQQT